MAKQNCWEFKACGRQPGGAKTGELGVCVAALEAKADGLHEGTNAGRVCWAVAGTLCGGRVQGSHAAKLDNCIKCEFFKKVEKEQNGSLKDLSEILARLYE